MRFGKLSLAAVATVALLSTPVLAQSATAASKTVGVSKVKRVGTATKEESKAEGSTGIIIGVVAAAAVIGGIIIISDDDEPNSP